MARKGSTNQKKPSGPNLLTIPFLDRAPLWMKASAFAVFGAIMVIALWLFGQDYATSVAGYRLLPSRKLETDVTAALVGALPQLIQIAMAWVLVTRAEHGRRLAAVVWLATFLADFGTDYYFKISALDWPANPLEHVFLAGSVMGETFFLFTLGSEWMLILAVNNLGPLLAPVTRWAWSGLAGRWAMARAAWQTASSQTEIEGFLGIPDKPTDGFFGDQGARGGNFARAQDRLSSD